jgi:peptide/nickel transport system substrate-binding protein
MAGGRHRGVMTVTVMISLASCTTSAGPAAEPTPTDPTRSVAPPSGGAVVEAEPEAAGRLEVITVANVLEPPLDDARVRQALALALDPGAIAAAGHLAPATTRFGFRLDRPPPIPDRDAARALLDAYRHDPARSDGEAPGTAVSVRFQCPYEPTLHARTLALVEQWSLMGVDVTHQNPEQHISSVIGHEEPEGADPFTHRGSWRGRHQLACWFLPADEASLDRLLDFVGEQATSPLNVTNVEHPQITEARDALLAGPAPFESEHLVATIVAVLEHDGVVMWHGIARAAEAGRSSDP